MKLESNAIGIVILTYNNFENTMQCLRSVHNQCVIPRRIVLCDNGSSNEIVDRILKEWDQIAEEKGIEKPVEVFGTARSAAPLVLLRLDENIGVGAGFNHALRFLLYDHECEAFWLLHNDTIAEHYALSALNAFVNDFYEEKLDVKNLKQIHDEKNAKISKNEHTSEIKETVKTNPEDLKSTQENVATDIQNNTAINKIDKKLGIVGSSLIFVQSNLQECAGGGIWKRFTGKTKLLDSGFERFAHSEQSEVMEKLDFINGASCLIMRNLIDEIGLFDDRFLLFYEDVDYGLRAKRAGFVLGWAHGSVVQHHAPCGKMLTPMLNLTEEPDLSANAEYFYIRNRFYVLARERFSSLFFAFINLFFTSSMSASMAAYQKQKKILDRKRNIQETKIKNINNECDQTQKKALPFKERLCAALDGVKGKMDKRIH